MLDLPCHTSFQCLVLRKEYNVVQSETGKKRAAENALKTPSSDKKAKVATPSGQKTGV